mmetsp:Transcript_27347/g.81682  ORF Transcript_27347/g.81682 Transcript_27347/m.81682 type:complete len:405 (+) Transcript_27347:1880-3094(+)
MPPWASLQPRLGGTISPPLRRLPPLLQRLRRLQRLQRLGVPSTRSTGPPSRGRRCPRSTRFPPCSSPPAPSHSSPRSWFSSTGLPVLLPPIGTPARSAASPQRSAEPASPAELSGYLLGLFSSAELPRRPPARGARGGAAPGGRVRHRGFREQSMRLGGGPFSRRGPLGTSAPRLGADGLPACRRGRVRAPPAQLLVRPRPERRGGDRRRGALARRLAARRHRRRSGRRVQVAQGVQPAARPPVGRAEHPLLLRHGGPWRSRARAARRRLLAVRQGQLVRVRRAPLPLPRPLRRGRRAVPRDGPAAARGPEGPPLCTAARRHRGLHPQDVLRRGATSDRGVGLARRLHRPRRRLLCVRRRQGLHRRDAAAARGGTALRLRFCRSLRTAGPRRVGSRPGVGARRR